MAATKAQTTVFTKVKLKDKDVEIFNTFTSMLTRMGAKIILSGETLTIEGSSALSGGIMLDTMGDSRVAKTLVILSTVFESPVTILSVEAGMIEQNTFLNEFIRLGGKVETV